MTREKMISVIKANSSQNMTEDACQRQAERIADALSAQRSGELSIPKKQLQVETLRLLEQAANTPGYGSDMQLWNELSNRVMRLCEIDFVPSDWREPAGKWLKDKADLETNSLHCGDSSGTIASTHRHAAILRSLAKEISGLSHLFNNQSPK